MNRVDKEHMAEWVDALESGEYDQGQRALRRPDDKFCCLGIACEVYRKATGIGSWEEKKGTDEGDVMAFRVPRPKNEHRSVNENSGQFVNAFVLPRAVAAYFFGWPSINPTGDFDGSPMGLATANDAGSSFEEIAAAIKRTFLNGE